MISVGEANNWIAGAGAVINVFLTITIIRITKKSTEESARSAKASEDSALVAKRSFEISKEALDIQKTKEQWISDYYRKYHAKAIFRYANECKVALQDAFPPTDKSDWDKMRSIKGQTPFQREDLIQYYTFKEIEHIFNLFDSFNEFKKARIPGNYGYDERTAHREAHLLIGELDALAMIYG